MMTFKDIWPRKELLFELADEWQRVNTEIRLYVYFKRELADLNRVMAIWASPEWEKIMKEMERREGDICTIFAARPVARDGATLITCRYIGNPIGHFTSLCHRAALESNVFACWDPEVGHSGPGREKR